MKTILQRIVLVLFFGHTVLGQVKSNLELIDIFNMEYVSDPQISPDGNKIIYVRNFKDVMTDKNLSNLWIVNFDGTKNRPLTTGNQNDFYPRWSHDGKKIIFKSNMSDGKMKLYLMWMDTKETVALTNTPKSPGQVSWSKDDKQLAFTMFVPKSEKSIVNMPTKPEGAKWNKPPTYITRLNYRGDGQGYFKGGNTQIFTLSIDGGTPRQWTSTNFDHGAPVWSKNGKNLYFSANFNTEEALEPLNSEIYTLSLADGKVAALTDRYGPDSNPVLSPDGTKLAYTGFDDTYQGYQLTKAYLLDIASGTSKLISDGFDRDIQNITWANSGKGIYFQFDDKGHTKIAYMNLNGNVDEKVKGLGGLSLGRPYNAAAYTVSKNDRFAYTLGSTEHPADLGTYEKNQTKRLTSLNDDLFAFRNLGKVEELWWDSSYDQRKIQGWVVTPPNFDPSKKYPMILEIHGGPFASYGAVYSAEIQAYAAAGYVVLYTNPRGSSGYGEEFGNLIHHDYPNHDYEDLMSGVDAVIKKGYIDESNLFVTGGSGGGVLTAWIVGKTDRFKAAVVAKPVINWQSFVLYADGASFFSKYWFGKKPWEDPESYFKRSPLSYVANVKTPTMLLTGEEDYRTPIAESEQFFAALKLENVESAMVRIPGASHGIANKPSNLIAKIASVLAWFEKYKK
ncbi:S9 family peptidase [Flagellimonas sp. HMM57]|uniref:S9 family peptidase n=1 Tax=unclassified Flagellimonas TaxID=2644544 RepID=UPI001F0A66AF|nr:MULTISPECIES: S9 family peptidase [unclassified Flagellimonas]UII75429.1 S9 family peptidase [Flagellimonas sp. HMM57]